MYEEEEEAGEKELEAEGDKEDSLLSQDQKLYYENLIVRSIMLISHTYCILPDKHTDTH